MKRIALVVILSMITASSIAAEPRQDQSARPAVSHKQNVPSEQEMKKAMEATYGAMVPIIERMADAIIESRLNAGAKPETANRIAAFNKNLYDALIRQGFSKDEALQIMVSTPLPVASLF